MIVPSSFSHPGLIVGIATAIVVSFCPPLVSSTETATRVHQPVVLDEGRYHVRVDDENQAIDNVSDYCLECHGGASPDGVKTAPLAEHLVSGLGRSHPVDVLYPTDDPVYRPVQELDQRLLLLDGRLTCFTCHATAVDRGLLAPMEQSRLCVSCHVM